MSIDPKSALRQARELTERGSYEEALEKYRWFDRHAVEADPSFIGVRGSLAFRRWAELGNLYPPARQELESARDERTQLLQKGAIDLNLFQDVESMNNVLGQVERTRDLFVWLASTNREFAGKCFSSAIAALVHTSEYSLARSFLSLPREYVIRSMRELNLNLADLPMPLPASSVRMKDAFIGIYAEDIFRVLSILVGVGETEEARSLCRESLQGIADPIIRAETREQLKRFSQGSNIDSLVESL